MGTYKLHLLANNLVNMCRDFLANISYLLTFIIIIIICLLTTRQLILVVYDFVWHLLKKIISLCNIAVTPFFYHFGAPLQNINIKEDAKSPLPLRTDQSTTNQRMLHIWKNPSSKHLEANTCVVIYSYSICYQKYTHYAA